MNKPKQTNKSERYLWRDGNREQDGIDRETPVSITVDPKRTKGRWGKATFEGTKLETSQNGWKTAILVLNRLRVNKFRGKK